MTHIVRCLAVSLFATIALGCEPPPGRGVTTLHDTVAASIRSFSDDFQLIDSVTFEQNDSVLIARLSGIDRQTNGVTLIGDVSEGNVKVYDSQGRLVRILGGPGAGPGEFQQPRFPRFGDDGLVHVGDGQASLVHVFSSSGYERTTTLSQFSPIMDLEVLPNGNYLLTAGSLNNDVLYEVDTSGQVLKSHLSRSGLRPAREPEHPSWRSVTQHWLALFHDEAVVATTVSNTLVHVDLATGNVRTTTINFPGYIAPDVPAEPPRTGPALLEWTRSFHIAATVLANSTQLFVPFVQGVLNLGDPMVLIAYIDGEWVAYTGAPPPIFLSDDVFLGLLTPNEEEVVLGVYALRGYSR